MQDNDGNDDDDDEDDDSLAKGNRMTTASYL